MNTKILPQPRRAGLLAVLAVVWAAAPALADSIRLSGLWVNGVTIQDIKGGEIVYVNAGGSQVKGNVADLDGVRMNAYPALEEAERLIGRKNDQGALNALAELQKKGVREAWLKVWMDYRIMTLADRVNKPVEAVEAAVRLAEAGAPAAFLAKAPGQSLGALTAEAKKDLSAKVDAVLPKVAAGPAAEALKKLREQIDAGGGGVPGTPATPGGIAPAVPGLALQGASAMPLAKGAPAADPITALLVKGDFEAAAAAADKALETETSASVMGLRLYQRGIAQLNRALKANDDPKLLKDAGLSLMRLVLYPNVAKNCAALQGPSLLEAGFIHVKLGRYDVARKLYERAGLYIDATEEPKLTLRREQLVKELNAVSAPEEPKAPAPAALNNQPKPQPQPAPKAEPKPAPKPAPKSTPKPPAKAPAKK